ncbi:MAG: GIY-YIG nuclease family protein [Anaerolineae bacterium]|nr:GIY-YIG nuclease family protein [Anaerolineae bacterium]
MLFHFELREYPTTPGCYLMRDAAGRVLYVGKAKNLRRRLSSYFRPDRRKRRTHRDHRMGKLVAAIAAIDVILVNTDLESLVLENNLIKHYQPRFNRMLMPEDSGYHYIVLTDEALPRLAPYRKLRLNKVLAGKDVEQRFGPYLTRECRDGLLEYVAGRFGLRTCYPMPSHVCLRYHLKECSGICEGKLSPAAYAAAVQAATDFLSRPGQDLVGAVVAALRDEVLVCAERLEFERAQRIKERLLILEATLQSQIVERDVDYDQDVVYFGPPETRRALVATLRHGMLLGVELRALSATTDYPQACRDFLLAQAARSGAEEIICNAPEAMAVRDNPLSTRLLCPTAGVEYELLALARRNFEYQHQKVSST